MVIDNTSTARHRLAQSSSQFCDGNNRRRGGVNFNGVVLLEIEEEECTSAVKVAGVGCNGFRLTAKAAETVFFARWSVFHDVFSSLLFLVFNNRSTAFLSRSGRQLHFSIVEFIHEVTIAIVQLLFCCVSKSPCNERDVAVFGRRQLAV